jgi:hypothetical protein
MAKRDKDRRRTQIKSSPAASAHTSLPEESAALARAKPRTLSGTHPHPVAQNAEIVGSLPTRTQQRRSTFLLWILPIPALIMSILWLTFVKPRTFPPPVQSATAPITATINAPKYAAVGDESYIDVTVRNKSGAPVNATATIIFSSDTARPLNEQGTTLAYELASYEVETKKLKFTMAKERTFNDGEEVKVSVLLTASNQNASAPDAQSTAPPSTGNASTATPSGGSPVEIQDVTGISVGPIPDFDTTLNWVLGGNLFGALGVLALWWWNGVRRRALGDVTTGKSE